MCSNRWEQKLNLIDEQKVNCSVLWQQDGMSHTAVYKTKSSHLMLRSVVLLLALPAWRRTELHDVEVQRRSQEMHKGKSRHQHRKQVGQMRRRDERDAHHTQTGHGRDADVELKQRRTECVVS